MHETMDAASLRRPDGSNYEIVGQEYPSDEMGECVGVGTYANVSVLEERHRENRRATPRDSPAGLVDPEKRDAAYVN